MYKGPKIIRANIYLYIYNVNTYIIEIYIRTHKRKSLHTLSIKQKDFQFKILVNHCVQRTSRLSFSQRFLGYGEPQFLLQQFHFFD